MKYIFITFEGLGLPIACKLQREGHEVIVGMIEEIKDYAMVEESREVSEKEAVRKKRMSLFDNMLEKRPAEDVLKWMKTVRKPHEYFVFFDVNNLYRWADKVRDLGFEGNFPTKEDYLFEIDREMAKDFVKKNYSKLHTPEVVEFTSSKDGIDFIKKTDRFWVLKGKTEGAKTFIPDVTDIELSRRQIIDMLTNFPEKYEKRGFIFELLIPSIIELTPEKIYYDGVPLVTTIDVENKAFGSGNISIQTGCAEDLVFPISMEDRINKIAFPPVVDRMAREHKGLFFWDASLLINKRDGKIYFGEFCSNRPGYNSLLTELAQAPSVNDFFEKVVHKMNPLPLGTVGSSVRLFNLNKDEETEEVAENIAVDFKHDISKDLWLWDVKRNQYGRLVSVGYTWNLGVMTGSGKSIDEAVSKMYRSVDDFSFLGTYYRSMDDFVSLDYPTSIPNRLNYGLERGLYHLPFDVRVGVVRSTYAK